VFAPSLSFLRVPMSICLVCYNLDWSLALRYNGSRPVRLFGSLESNGPVGAEDGSILTEDGLTPGRDDIHPSDNTLAGSEVSGRTENRQTESNYSTHGEAYLSLAGNDANQRRREEHFWSQLEDVLREMKIKTDSHSLIASVKRGCGLCSILYQGILELDRYTASLGSPWKPWSLDGSCGIQIIISLRHGRTVQLHLEKSKYQWKEDLQTGQGPVVCHLVEGTGIELFTSVSKFLFWFVILRWYCI
jgi:hypothetical protein